MTSERSTPSSASRAYIWALNFRCVFASFAPKISKKKDLSGPPTDRGYLINVSDEEIIIELRSQGVIRIRRLRPKNGKTNAHIRLTFFGKTPPTEIRAGIQDIAIKPWIRSPMLCRHCARYGHTAKR